MSGCGHKKTGLDIESKPDFKFLVLKDFIPVGSEREASPVVQLRLLRLAAAFLARLFVIATGARFAQRAFTIELLLEASQCFVDGLAFF